MWRFLCRKEAPERLEKSEEAQENSEEVGNTSEKCFVNS